MPDILTIPELATWLKLSESQVRTMCKSRARARMTNPLPMLKLNGNVRFRRADVERWLEKVAKEAA